MADPSVLAVVVVHGSGTWLEETLRALGAQTYTGADYVFASVGEASVPSGILPSERVRGVVALPAGTGFAEAVMRALQAAGEIPAYVWILHDDVAPEPEVLERLVARVSSDPAVAAAGPKLVDWDNPEILQEVGGAIDRFAGRRSGLDAGEVDHGQHDDTEDVLFCSAACLLVRRDDFDAARGLDPDGWPLYEDVDLGWRLRRSGRRVVVVTDVRARHAQALVRGLREPAPKGTGPLGTLAVAERGRLWFMLKNYGGLSLAVLLPQLVALEVFRAAGGVLRREFWRTRSVFSAWLKVARDLPHIAARRRHPGRREVEDQELLRLAARRALTERRYERVAGFERATLAAQTWLRRIAAVMREPVAWAVALAVVASLVALRDVLFSGPFVLGEIRPPVALLDSVRAYLASVRPEGFDRVGAASPGIVLLGAVRTLLLGSAAGAEKLALVGPILLTAVGGARLGRRVGLGLGGRRWLAVLAMVNPFTLVLLRRGSVGALLAWAASMWVGSALLQPTQQLHPRERARRLARWAVMWIVAVALHPPAFVWFGALAITMIASRPDDGRNPQRLRLLLIGVVASFVGLLPWSLSWFSWPSPILGGGTEVFGSGGGLPGATFGGGIAALVWIAVSIAATYAVGPTRTTLAVGSLGAVAWLAGTAGAIPAPTALVAVGWTTLLLLAFVARRVADEVGRYNLGWRQVLVIAIVAAVGSGWGLAVVEAAIGGTDATPVPLLAPPQSAVGRVIWLSSSAAGTTAHASDGFALTMRAFPAPTGKAAGMVHGGLKAARSGRTHRLGALLALADVSHVVALDPKAADGLSRQADLAPAERLGRSTVYSNGAWAGPAMLLDAAPRDVLGPRGLADLVRRVERVRASERGDGSLTVRVPSSARGVLYLAVGAQRGWDAGGERLRPAAAGAWTRAGSVEGRVAVAPPAGWWRVLYIIGAALALLLVAVWITGAYLATPERARAVEPIDLLAPALPRFVGVLVVTVLAAGAWVGWRTDAAAGPFLSTAWYCPPPGEGWGEQVALVNPNREAATYIVRPRLDAPPANFGTLEGRGHTTLGVDPQTGAVVETYGRRMVAAAEVTRQGKGAATLCTPSAPDRAYFAEGGRAATRARPRLYEVYVVHNPFPELARASFRFIAPDETIAPPALQDVRVDPGTSVFVRPEEQFEPMPGLSVEVRIWQGRAVAARRLCIGIVCNEGRAEEIHFSTGVEPADHGVLPRARTTQAQSTLTAVNPNDDAATVEMFFVTPEGSLPSEQLNIAPQSRDSFNIHDIAEDVDALVVRYRSTKPVAVEGLVAPRNRRSVSLFPGLQEARRWVIPAGVRRTLVVTNPGTHVVRVRVTRLGPGPRIRTLRIGPSRVGSVELSGEDPFGVLVEAEGGEVTAAAIGGGGALAGYPLR